MVAGVCTRSNQLIFLQTPKTCIQFLFHTLLRIQQHIIYDSQLINTLTHNSFTFLWDFNYELVREFNRYSCYSVII